ncbi:MAG: hypothetical protein IJI14_10955 [Anaerolineaceae bacterium]|nr:hypothetical protein [Anaerolineaceae bacterium]
MLLISVPKKNDDNLTLNNELMGKGIEIKNLLKSITPAEKLDDSKIPSGLEKILFSIDNLSQPMTAILARDPDLFAINKAELRKARTALTRKIHDLNTLLFSYYDNDKRLHEPVVSAISIINHLIFALDKRYNVEVNNEEKMRENEDLGEIEKDFYTGEYTFDLNDDDSLTMSPSHYESFLQIFKTPKAALEAYNKLLKLVDKNQNEELSPSERKELNKCLRIEELANDFDRSHHYMTDKQIYSQQYVDYAFSLGKKERKTEGENDQLPENEMYQAPDSIASTTYKLLIMQKNIQRNERALQTEIRHNDLRRKYQLLAFQ